MSEALSPIKTEKKVTTDVQKLEKGDIVSYTQYFKYTGNNLNGRGEFIDQNGDLVNISNSIIEKSAFNNRQYHTEKKVSRTELIEALSTARDCVVYVEFITQKGEERHMTARLMSVENLFGRSNAIDLKLELSGDADNYRLIDHRTVNRLILRGILYNVKNKKKATK